MSKLSGGVDPAVMEPARPKKTKPSARQVHRGMDGAAGDARCTDEVRSGDGAAGAVARNDRGDGGALLTAAATQSKCYNMRH